MLWLTSLMLSVRSLAAHKLRSFLATLGIVIGVTSVISLLALGTGARAFLLGKMSGLKDLCFVFPDAPKRHGATHSSPSPLSLGDGLTLVHLPEVRCCVPMMITYEQAKRYDKNTHVLVMGVAPPYFAARGYTFERGRGFTEAEDDGTAQVVVLAGKTAKTLFGTVDPIGETLLLGGIKLRVIGVLNAKDDDFLGMSSDDRIVIGLGLAQQSFMHTSSVNQLLVQSAAGVDGQHVEHAVTRALRRRHHLLEDDANDFAIFTPQEQIDQFASFTAALSALLGAIGGVSLVVGGIGIMNIMLVSITERTREIGVRKAIGARNRDILRQFLIESVLLTSAGGAIGVVFGAALMALAGHFLPFTPLLQWPSVATALGFSAAVGIFFGYYPARRAARLDPIEALRYE